MRRLFTCTLLMLCGCAFAATAAGKDAEPKDEVVWQEKVTPGPAVTLRIKRSVGKSLIYEGTLDRSQQAANAYVETNKFFLNVLTADKEEAMIKDQKKRLDRVAIWRTYTDRKRTESFENNPKKKIDRVLPNGNDLINLGPNFVMVGNLRCYVFDAQNSVAFSTEQLATMKDGRQLHGRVLSEDEAKLVFLTGEEKVELARKELIALDAIPVPHVLLNETPHYFFPIFSARKVAPGDTWKFKVPVIIPLEQGNPPRLLPTQFTAGMVARLREVTGTGDDQVAVVDYQVTGLFDSTDEQYASRFPPEFLEANRIVHKFSGSGSLSMNVEKGRIIEKSEAFSVTLYASSTVPQGLDKEPKKEENQADIQSQFHIKLLPPGFKLPAGGVIPEYD